MAWEANREDDNRKVNCPLLCTKCLETDVLKYAVHLRLVAVDRSDVEPSVPDRLLELVADVLLVAEDDAARLGRDVLLDHGHEEVAFGSLVRHLKPEGVII